ncbi:uncharacterized protein MYCFIDRAFT_210422 [Pseudocercospora fijiensis CIRAD86]|uniref:Uncharacterized protein n=1 Tax=Pseudocercospora fijiensis (strain CIRAD86) TaxID=383855 RepID=M3BA58_PSEFD|nr:uncharacterized protein MYCFIDRAFT_210422 [Pseudocercospora fijiensis CIRAD86]EME86143.1 hypothetical protein MYCFIDRAFT_210422 [Pseudocercospora fijiensis CIRAD86]
MSILYDQLYKSTPLLPKTSSEKSIQYTPMFQSANAQKENEKMSSTQPRTGTQSVVTSSSDSDDRSSVWSKSTGTSTITVIKERMKRSSKDDEKRTPAQKEAEKKAGRLSYVTLGTLAALKG